MNVAAKKLQILKLTLFTYLNQQTTHLHTERDVNNGFRLTLYQIPVWKNCQGVPETLCSQQ